MLQLLQGLLGLAALVCVPIGCIALARMPYESRRRVPWRPLDLALIFLTYIAAMAMAFFVVAALTGTLQAALSGEVENVPGDPTANLTPEQLMANLVAQGVVNLITMGLAILWLRGRHQASVTDLGLSTRYLRSDVMIGAVSFLGLLLPTFGLKWLLDTLLQPTAQHPVISLLEENPSPAMMGSALFTAFLVAPLTEEFFYRVLLQGWLEKLALGMHASPQTVVEDEGPSESFDGDPANSAVQAETVNPPSAPGREVLSSDNPYAASQVEAEATAVDPIPQEDLEGGPRPWWPMVISSLIFAMMHISNSITDALVLFFFALALGYLYRQTHRLWPSVVVHMLLNGLSLTALFLSVGN